MLRDHISIKRATFYQETTSASKEVLYIKRPHLHQKNHFLLQLKGVTQCHGLSMVKYDPAMSPNI